MEKYNIIISPRAQSDLAERVSFISRVSFEAGIKLADDIYSSIESLETFPERNPIFEMMIMFPFVIRKLIVNNIYIILYSIEENDVVILRIIDSRRKFNSLLK